MKPLLIALWGMGVLASVLLAFSPVGLPLGPYGDKMIHVTSCALVMLLPAVVCRRYREVVYIALLLTVAGFTIEFVHGMMVERESSGNDIIANTIGILYGMLAGYLLRSGYKANPPAGI